MNGDARGRIGTGLIVLALALFVVPAFVPVQPMLTHDTGSSTTATEAQLQEEGTEIIAYGNLSERGQELYVQALEANGEYRVPVGEGASDFRYPTSEELANTSDFDERERLTDVAIERPDDDSGLPPADERQFGGRENEPHVQRFDLMETRTDTPPLTAPPQLLRLGAALLAVLSLGVGGYLLTSK